MEKAIFYASLLTGEEVYRRMNTERQMLPKYNQNQKNNVREFTKRKLQPIEIDYMYGKT